MPFAQDLENDVAYDRLRRCFRGYQRRFAITQDNVPLSQRARHTTEAFFGQRIWTLRPKPTPKTTALICSDRKFAANSTADGFELKRKMVWKNRDRNRFIAAVATAMLARDANALRHHGVPVEPAIEAAGQAPVWRVAVLVESGVHAAELSALLTGWGLMRLEDGKSEDWQFEPDGAIVTLSWAAKQGLCCDVIIRADAGLPVDPGYLGIGTVPFLVDFRDPGGDQHNLSQRIKGYARVGMTVVVFDDAANDPSILGAPDDGRYRSSSFGGPDCFSSDTQSRFENLLLNLPGKDTSGNPSKNRSDRRREKSTIKTRRSTKRRR